MYSRDLDGKTYTFGVSGKLWRDALLMYDHQTRSLWSHITGEAIQGPLKGKRLKMLASMPQIAWKTWQTNYPNTSVLSVPFRGSMRESLSRDSYQRYHTSQDTGVSGTEYTDDRLPNKSLVIGVQVQTKDGAPGRDGADGQDGADGGRGGDGGDGGAGGRGGDGGQDGTAGQDGAPGRSGNFDPYNTQFRAYPLTHFAETTVINDMVGEVPLLIFHDKVSFATAVFKRNVAKDVRNFRSQDGHFVEDNTGTRWNLVTGAATSGKDKGKRLERLPAVNIYWFAWARYYPQTTIYRQ
ncbi:DUF3179 domain-containing protein [Candidatus Poribacteria bacterium]|nr:DUF3179 domain-containing protein [Candidatus Poribacteria bacterium]